MPAIYADSGENALLPRRTESVAAATTATMVESCFPTEKPVLANANSSAGAMSATNVTAQKKQKPKWCHFKPLTIPLACATDMRASLISSPQKLPHDSKKPAARLRNRFRRVFEQAQLPPWQTKWTRKIPWSMQNPFHADRDRAVLDKCHFHSPGRRAASWRVELARKRSDA